MVVLDSSGYWRIGSLKPPCAPMSRISRLTTLASTGRLMKMSVKAMWLLFRPLRLRRQGLRIVDLDGGVGVKLELAAGHDLLAFLHAFQNRDLVALARPDAYETPFDGELRRRHFHLAHACRLLRSGRTLLHHPHAVAIKSVGHRGARDRHELLRLAFEHSRIGEHARQQQMVTIGQSYALHERARVLRHAGIEGLDHALEHLSRIGVDAELNWGADLEFAEIAFRNGKVDPDRV